MQQGTAAAFARWLARHRWPLACLSLAGSALLATGLPRIGFDTSLDSLLSASDPYLAEGEVLAAHFPRPLEIRFAFVPPPGQSAVAPAVLAALARFQEDYRVIPGAVRASSLLSYFSPQRQAPLFEGDFRDYSAAELRDLEARALAEPLLAGNLLGEAAGIAFGVVAIDDSGFTEAERRQVASAARRLRERLQEAHPAVTVAVTGAPLLEQGSAAAMNRDLTRLLPLIILVCVALMGLCFQSARLAGVILGHQLLTLLGTLGAVGHLGVPLNSISVIAPLIVIIIAVANSVHVISLFRQGQLRQASSLVAAGESLAENLRPVTLVAVTTTIGFASLSLSSSPAIEDFGRTVALGIGIAFLLTFTVLPAMLVFLCPTWRGGKRGALAGAHFAQPALAWLDRFVRRRDRPLFLAYTALALVTFALLPLNETDFDRWDFIPEGSEVAAYFAAVAERTDRGPTLIYAIDTGRAGGARMPDFLCRVEAFSQWLTGAGDLPAVTGAVSVADVIKAVSGHGSRTGPAVGSLPDDPAAIDFLLRGYERVQSPDLPLSSFINQDFSVATLLVSAGRLSNQELLDLDRGLTEEFGRRFPDARLLHGSSLLLFARMDERVTVELLRGYALSLLAITAVLAVGLGSFHYGLLSVVPNLLPATMVFGAWGLLSGQLDPFVMMLFSISIGLVVDDTIHILSHYLQARKAGGAHAEAVTAALLKSGPALTITTLILALGTTLLMGADTIYFRQAATLLVPIVALALVLDFSYLPTVLKRADRLRQAFAARHWRNGP